MAFSYYASLTVDNTKVGGSTGSLSNFPILVSGTYDGTGGEPDLRVTGSGGNVTSANGYDIYFYDDSSASTKYDHEILYYNSTTGQYIAWVRVPTLNKGSDTTLYMHYGDSGITVDPSATTTWDSSYKAVLHGAAASDSSQQNHTVTGVNTPTITTTGAKIYSAHDLELSSTQYYTVDGAAADLSADSTLTVSAWVKPESLTTFHMIWANQSGGNCYLSTNVAKLRIRWQGAGSIWYSDTTNNVLSTATWYLVHFVRVSDSVMKLYVNGADITALSTTGSGDSPPTLTGQDMILGQYSLDQGSIPFDGMIEEARVSANALDADTILTEYNNQNDPSTFYTMGSETAAGGATIAASRRIVNSG